MISIGTSPPDLVAVGLFSQLLNDYFGHHAFPPCLGFLSPYVCLLAQDLLVSLSGRRFRFVAEWIREPLQMELISLAGGGSWHAWSATTHLDGHTQRRGCSLWQPLAR